MPAISETSVLVVYSKIARLALLADLYGTVLIPSEVHSELVVGGRPRPGSDAVARLPWLKVIAPVAHSEAVLHARLGPGESLVIDSCIALGAGIPVLLDDFPARRLAARMHLTVIGSAGILIAAKRRALISHVEPHLQALRGAGLYLSAAAIRQVLELANELP